jgi:hypothetical protein
VLSQERTQVNVQVRSVAVAEAGSQFACRVVVFSKNDDDARQTKVLILLPVGVKLVSSSTGCAASPPAGDGTQALSCARSGR